MKLWLKQTLICLLIMLLTFGTCLYFFVAQQTQQMLNDTQLSALQNVNVFCGHLSALDRAGIAGYGTDETTLRAMIQYTFSSCAHLLQSSDCSYSLVMDGDYLYNISAYQPMQLLPLMLRRTLRPLRKLTRVSEEISGGKYSLRSGIASRDEVGELSAFFDYMADTVEQKILDLEEQARRRELLLGALTHEMKTPMTAIIGFSDSLLSMPLTEEKRMEAAHEIHEAALRTERLSQKMMQLIAMKDCPVLVKRRLSVKELFQQIQHMMHEPLGEKHLTLTTRTEIDTLHGDADLLLCLLTNLIDNAIKASRPGQEIILTAAADDADFALSVSDHGSGIPADKIPLVTEPSYRVDKARSRKLGGAGLGLSLCRMIAQVHGGSLRIESAVGSGTTITMAWPGEGSNE